jgi:alkaline phosphatase
MHNADYNYQNLPTASLLAGSVTTHGTGMSALALDQCGYPIDFSPLDYEEDGGHMVLWNDTKGGMYPWDDGYYSVDNNNKPAFDPEYITRHAPDSAATATCMATGYKTGPYMLSLDLYEQQVSTILEDAIRCGKAGGVVTSVPILHATPAAFMSHSNNRLNRDQIRQGFRSVNPTIVSGVCYSRYYPFPQDLESMQTGALSSQWTFLHQQEGVLAEDFYAPVQELDPNNGDQILVCLGGDYSPSRRINLPYRGLDGDYANRWCSRGSKVRDPDTREYIGVIPTTSDTLCNHYTQEEVAQIPSIATNVEEGIKFLGKHGDGFFMLYEQGDVSSARYSKRR